MNVYAKREKNLTFVWQFDILAEPYSWSCVNVYTYLKVNTHTHFPQTIFNLRSCVTQIVLTIWRRRGRKKRILKYSSIFNWLHFRSFLSFYQTGFFWQFKYFHRQYNKYSKLFETTHFASLFCYIGVSIRWLLKWHSVKECPQHFWQID